LTERIALGTGSKARSSAATALLNIALAEERVPERYRQALLADTLARGRTVT